MAVRRMLERIHGQYTHSIANRGACRLELKYQLYRTTTRALRVGAESGTTGKLLHLQAHTQKKSGREVDGCWFSRVVEIEITKPS